MIKSQDKLVKLLDRQQKCLENCHTWFGLHGSDLKPQPEIVKTDRVFFAATLGLQELIGNLEQSGVLRKWDAVKNHGTTARRGWRESVAACSAQIIDHGALFEMDFDQYNPGYGAGPAFLHLFEMLRPGKTDPFKIGKILAKRIKQNKEWL